MRKITKRSVAILSGSVLAVAGGTAAFAYASGWFNGQGNVTATSSTIQPVVANITGVSNVWPNHWVDASVQLGNYNEFPVTAQSVDTTNPPVVKVYDDAAALTAGTESTACGAGDADIVLNNNPEDVNVAAGAWVNTTFTNFIAMDTTADPACAGKIFKVTFKLNGDIQSS